MKEKLFSLYQITLCELIFNEDCTDQDKTRYNHSKIFPSYWKSICFLNPTSPNYHKVPRPIGQYWQCQRICVMEHSFNGIKLVITSQNNSMLCIGRDLKDSSKPIAMGRDTSHRTRLLKIPYNLALNTPSRDGAFTFFWAACFSVSPSS